MANSTNFPSLRSPLGTDPLLVLPPRLPQSGMALVAAQRAISLPQSPRGWPSGTADLSGRVITQMHLDLLAQVPTLGTADSARSAQDIAEKIGQLLENLSQTDSSISGSPSEVSSGPALDALPEDTLVGVEEPACERRRPRSASLPAGLEGTAIPAEAGGAAAASSAEEEGRLEPGVAEEQVEALVRDYHVYDGNLRSVRSQLSEARSILTRLNAKMDDHADELRQILSSLQQAPDELDLSSSSAPSEWSQEDDMLPLPSATAHQVGDLEQVLFDLQEAVSASPPAAAEPTGEDEATDGSSRSISPCSFGADNSAPVSGSPTLPATPTELATPTTSSAAQLTETSTIRVAQAPASPPKPSSPISQFLGMLRGVGERIWTGISSVVSSLASWWSQLKQRLFA